MASDYDFAQAVAMVVDSLCSVSLDGGYIDEGYVYGMTGILAVSDVETRKNNVYTKLYTHKEANYSKCLFLLDLLSDSESGRG